jgi:hypothetical protein
VADFDALNPYAPPQHVAEELPGKLRQATFDGKLLTFDKAGMLPDICLKCGAPEPVVRRKHAFSYTPPWVYLMFPLCWLGALVTMAIIAKRATLMLPLCPSCNTRWRSAKIALLVSGLALLSPLFVGVFAPVRQSDDAGAIILVVFLLTLTVFIAVALGYARPRTVQAKKIDDVSITLGGVHPRAAEVVVTAARTVV